MYATRFFLEKKNNFLANFGGKYKNVGETYVSKETILSKKNQPTLAELCFYNKLIYGDFQSVMMWHFTF